MNIKGIIFPKSKQNTPNPTTQQVIPESSTIQNKNNLNRPIVTPGQEIDTGKGFQPPKPKRKISLKILLIPIGLVLLIFVIGLIYKAISTGFGGKTYGEKGHITWWGISEKEAISTLIEEYQSQNDGITIEYVQQSSVDYRERLQNSLRRNEGPDIFEFHNTWVPMFTTDLSLIPQTVISKEDYQNTYYPVVVNSMSMQNGFVGIPLSIDAMVLYVNDDAFTSAADRPPDNWTDFFNLAKKMTQKPDNQILMSGAAMGLTGNVDNWQEIIGLLMIQNGVDFRQFQDEKVGRVFDYYASFASKDKTWDDTLPDSTVAFANGKLAMLLAPTSRFNEIREINPNLNFYTTEIPQKPKDDPSVKDINYATFWSQGVWELSVNKESAWNFLKFITTAESLKTINSYYHNIGKLNGIYPRRDMVLLQKNDVYLAPAVVNAENMKTWYLADITIDGEEGINTQIARPFEELIEFLLKGGSATPRLKVFSEGLIPVLNSFGIK